MTLRNRGGGLLKSASAHAPYLVLGLIAVPMLIGAAHVPVPLPLADLPAAAFDPEVIRLWTSFFTTLAASILAVSKAFALALDAVTRYRAAAAPAETPTPKEGGRS